MVRRTFVLEASFAILAIVLGTVLGLVMAYNVVHDFQAQPGNENLTFSVPWLNLLVVFGAVYRPRSWRRHCRHARRHGYCLPRRCGTSEPPP